MPKRFKEQVNDYLGQYDAAAGDADDLEMAALEAKAKLEHSKWSQIVAGIRSRKEAFEKTRKLDSFKEGSN